MGIDRKNSDERKKQSEEDPRQSLIDLQKKRRTLDNSKSNRKSLEGLRFGALLRQLEALQALQGLQELNPASEKHAAPFKIAQDPVEREHQRQWLRFKADWLEALLESTLNDLEKLEAVQKDKTSTAPTDE